MFFVFSCDLILMDVKKVNVNEINAGILAYLGDAVNRNYEKWGYSFDEKYDYLTPKERNVRSYDEAINQLKDFIVKRGAWLDKNIETLRQYSHESKIKKFNH